MLQIRPVSDLRNKFPEIENAVSDGQPVFLTKNGFGDMVVLSMEAYENLHFESEIYFKLQEAEREAETTKTRYSSKDVLNAMFLEDSQKNIEAPSGRFLDFKTMLRRLGTPLGADTADTGADSIRKRRERLKGL